MINRGGLRARLSGGRRQSRRHAGGCVLEERRTAEPARSVAPTGVEPVWPIRMEDTSMKTKSGCLAMVAAGFMLAVVSTGAHHAFSAEFDINKPLELEGTLVKWEMINPHSWFHLDVMDPDGTVTTWLVEGGSPNELIRQGVTMNTVPVGVQLIIEGYHAKDGTPKAVGRNFVLEDGNRLFLGGSANNIAGER